MSAELNSYLKKCGIDGPHQVDTHIEVVRLLNNMAEEQDYRIAEVLRDAAENTRKVAESIEKALELKTRAEIVRSLGASAHSDLEPEVRRIFREVCECAARKLEEQAMVIVGNLPR